MEINIENLPLLLNKEIKWKELCDTLEISYGKGGRQRKLRKNKIRLYCNLIELPKAKFKITEIYDEANIKDKGYKRLDCFNVPKILEHNAGIYKIYSKNTIYIGQTQDFLLRLYRHRSNTTFSKNAGTYNLLNNGGKMEIIELQNDKQIRLQREQMYIDLYTKLGYKVLNVESLANNRKKGNKRKYKTIKLKMSDYKKALDVLKENNIEVI